MKLAQLTSTIGKRLHATKPIRNNTSNQINIFFSENMTMPVKSNKLASPTAWLKSILGELKYKISRPIVKIAYLGSLENNRKLFTGYLSKNFLSIKHNIANSKLEKYFLDEVNLAESPDKLCSIIYKYKYNSTMSYTDKINLVLCNQKLTRAEKDLIINSEKKPFMAKMFELEKALIAKSTDPKCIELEQLLKDRFGLNIVSLQDDYEQGKKILKVCELLQSNGLKLPKNFIISNSIPGSGQALTTESCVLLNSSCSINLTHTKGKGRWSSTDNNLHELVHECGHIIQPANIYTAIIPKEFKNTIKSLSGYAKTSKSNAEIWAELFAKKYLSPQAFTPEEEHLFTFLSNC